MTVELTDGFVDVGNDVRLHIVSAGSGPLVVCYHGFPSCWASFRPQIEALASEYRVVSVDGLGANLSSKPDDLSMYRVEHLVGQLDRCALALGGDEPFSLIGHDWGGALAWAYAQARPERLHGVVALSAPPYNQLIHLLQSSEEQRTRSSYMWTMRDGKQHRHMTQNTRQLWEDMYAPLRRLPHFTEEIDRQFSDAFAQPGAIDGGINWYRANIPVPDELDGFVPWPSASARVTVPGLLIWGDADRTFIPEFVDGLADYVDDLSVCRLAETGHSPMFEQPDRVNQTIREFLDRTVTSSRFA